MNASKQALLGNLTPFDLLELLKNETLKDKIYIPVLNEEIPFKKKKLMKKRTVPSSSVTIAFDTIVVRRTK